MFNQIERSGGFFSFASKKLAELAAQVVVNIDDYKVNDIKEFFGKLYDLYEEAPSILAQTEHGVDFPLTLDRNDMLTLYASIMLRNNGYFCSIKRPSAKVLDEIQNKMFVKPITLENGSIVLMFNGMSIRAENENHMKIIGCSLCPLDGQPGKVVFTFQSLNLNHDGSEGDTFITQSMIVDTNDANNEKISLFIINEQGDIENIGASENSWGFPNYLLTLLSKVINRDPDIMEFSEIKDLRKSG